jgi:hypothetical protein
MTSNPTDPTGTLYRVLAAPDSTFYVYGRFGISNLLDLPVITHGDGTIVAILDTRSVVETAQERETIYMPPAGDLTWLSHHPEWPGYGAA